MGEVRNDVQRLVLNVRKFDSIRYIDVDPHWFLQRHTGRLLHTLV